MGSTICKFVEMIDYRFHFPSILLPILFIIDPMNTSNSKVVSFEMLYEIGTVVLSTVNTLCVATNCCHLLRAKEANSNNIDRMRMIMHRIRVHRLSILSVAFLSQKYRFHRLYTHIPTLNVKS